jgi:hypothetical protein
MNHIQRREGRVANVHHRTHLPHALQDLDPLGNVTDEKGVVELRRDVLPQTSDFEHLFELIHLPSDQVDERELAERLGPLIRDFHDLRNRGSDSEYVTHMDTRHTSQPQLNSSMRTWWLPWRRAASARDSQASCSSIFLAASRATAMFPHSTARPNLVLSSLTKCSATSGYLLKLGEKKKKGEMTL